MKLDDKAERIAARFDAYCTYHRLSKMEIGSGLDSEAVHNVTITLDEKGPDKAKILFEKNRPDLEAHPEKYAGRNWYAGSVMLIGELVE